MHFIDIKYYLFPRRAFYILCAFASACLYYQWFIRTSKFMENKMMVTLLHRPVLWACVRSTAAAGIMHRSKLSSSDSGTSSWLMPWWFEVIFRHAHLFLKPCLRFSVHSRILNDKISSWWNLLASRAVLASHRISSNQIARMIMKLSYYQSPTYRNIAIFDLLLPDEAKCMYCQSCRHAHAIAIMMIEMHLTSRFQHYWHVDKWGIICACELVNFIVTKLAGGHHNWQLYIMAKQGKLDNFTQ